jgi:hypothetical protein
MAKQRSQATARRVEQLTEQYLAATSTVAEANCLDELAKAVNRSAKPALTPAIIERLTHKYRAATTSVGRGNRLDQLAGIADMTGSSALKWWVLEAAEASTDEADESLRIVALEVLQWLGIPDDEHRQRVIDWVLGRIEAAGRRSNERTYAVTASRLWVRVPRVQARLLGLLNDETEEGGLRLLALDCFTLLGPGEAPRELLDACHRLASVYPEEADDSGLGRKARRVLAKVNER